MYLKRIHLRGAQPQEVETHSEHPSKYHGARCDLYNLNTNTFSSHAAKQTEVGETK